MKSDMFVNMTAHSTLCPLECLELDGVTWSRPKDTGAGCVCLNLLSVIDNLLLDFFRLGRLLKESIAINDYQPYYFVDSLISGVDNNRHQILFDDDIFRDDRCPFFKKDKMLIINSIIDFMNKYGSLGGAGGDGVDDSYINSYVRKKFGDRLYFTTVPLSWAAYKIFELYFKYSDPQNYSLLSQKNPCIHARRVGPSALNANVRLKVRYSGHDWEERKDVDSIIDLITLFLFYNEEKLLRECPCCGDFFLTTNQKAVYCSPICRNRFNSKKSYDKKKGEHNADNPETR